MAGEQARLALRDPDTEVRVHAARAAIALGIDRGGDEVVEWLQARETRLRVVACEVIEASPTFESLAALARALADSKSEVREAAARAMGAGGSADAVAALLGRLDDPAVSVRRAALRALGRVGDARAAVPVVSKLQDGDAEVRVEAAKVLGLLGDSASVAPLELALEDKDVSVRLAVIEALGRLGAPNSVTAIVAIVGRDTRDTSSASDHVVRPAAIRALAKIGTTEAVAALVSMLESEGPVAFSEDSSAHVRTALATMRDRAERPLRELVDKSRSLRSTTAAALALATVATPKTAQAAVASIVSAARRGSIQPSDAIIALERVEHPDALAYVIERLDDADVGVRSRAVAVAAKLLSPERHDGRVLDVIRKRILDPRTPSSERLGLAMLVGRSGSARGVELLLALLPPVASPGGRAASVSLRVAALRGLSDLGAASPAAEARILEYIGDDSGSVRMAAATALAKVGGDTAAERLLELLGASAAQDRAALSLALSGVLSRTSSESLARRASKLLATLAPPIRDALIEGLGRSSTRHALATLVELGRVGDVDDRRKIAEALAGRSGTLELVTRLGKDVDAGVRANAAWAMGESAEAAQVELISTMTRDVDVAVAANATAALAKLAIRLGATQTIAPKLCELLEEPRAFVVWQALVGLRRLDSSCEPSSLRRLVSNGKTPRIRGEAARLVSAGLSRRSQPEARLDELALARCAEEEKDADAARACIERPIAKPTSGPAERSNDLVVFVVPGSGDEPMPRAPFTVVLPHGEARSGVADRRGAVFLRGLPDGLVSLAAPAALAP